MNQKCINELYVFLIYGVHGYESVYTKHVAESIKNLLEARLRKKSTNIIIIGPYSKWATKHSLHFSKDIQDPNRLHAKEVNSSHAKLPDLIISRNIYKTLIHGNRFNIDSYLRLCMNQDVDLGNVSTSSQTYFKDFLGYVDYKNWNTQRRKRERLIWRVKSKIKQGVQNPQCIFIDVHAGIGKPNTFKIIYKTNNKLVADSSCFLVDGLARDFKNKNANFYVLEIGLKGTTKMLENVITELYEREKHGSIKWKGKAIFGTQEYEEWKVNITNELKNNFLDVFYSLSGSI